MRFAITLISALALWAHMALGCCAHHAHAATADHTHAELAGHRSCLHHHAGHQHAGLGCQHSSEEHQQLPTENDGQPSDGHAPCHDSHCVFNSVSKAQLPVQIEEAIATVWLPVIPQWQQPQATQFATVASLELGAQKLRTHLALCVLQV